MDDLKIYRPEETEDVPFPQEGEASFGVTTGSEGGGNYSPQKTSDIPFPDPRIAHEVLSRSINTKSRKILQEFQFTVQGAIQIGEYTPGISGEIRISPNGIVARNSLGNETIAIDGESGDAVFAGTIQTGAIISGRVIVGDNTVVIDGENGIPRILLYNDGIPQILIGRRA
jgi:hypothetical protein